WIVVDPPVGPGFLEFLQKQMGQLDETVPSISAVILTSCAPESSGGVLRLVQKYKPLVFVAKAGIPILRETLPKDTRIVDAETLNTGNEWPFRTIPVSGLGVAPAAYLLTHEDKRILISGRIPTKLDSRNQMQEFLRDVRASRGGTIGFQDSIDLLAPIQPDIWLPTHPVNGQNANLYDDQWQKVLDRNRNAVQGKSRN
ncbi:MAG: hypothetical protein VX311_14480, partial [Planctomycetota bacterium]|nr:hypothetical protein [Planctomycetota bacterium]